MQKYSLILMLTLFSEVSNAKTFCLESAFTAAWLLTADGISNELDQNHAHFYMVSIISKNKTPDGYKSFLIMLDGYDGLARISSAPRLDQRIYLSHPWAVAGESGRVRSDPDSLLCPGERRGGECEVKYLSMHQYHVV